MAKRKPYDKNKIGGRSSGTELVYRKRRMAIIAVWLVICVGFGVAFYFNYSKDNYSDTPVKQIQLDGGVKTGCPLDDDKSFGPWGSNY